MIKLKHVIVAAVAPVLLLSVACGGGGAAGGKSSKEWRGLVTPTFAAFVNQGTPTPAPPSANWAALGLDGTDDPTATPAAPRTESTPATPAQPVATPVATSAPRGSVPGLASPVRGRHSAGPERYRFAATMSMTGDCTDAAVCQSETSIGGVRLDGAAGLDMRVEGVYIAPDRVQARCTGNLGGIILDEEVIVVAGATWVKDRPNATWTRKRPQFCDIDERFADLSEPIMADGLEDFTVVARDAKVNGVAASQYSMSLDFTHLLADLVTGIAIDQEGGTLSLDPDEIPEVKMEMGLDVWLANSGEWPVRLVFRFGGSAESESFNFVLTWDTLDVNNPDLRVDSPA